MIRLDVHPLQLSGNRVEETDGAASDCAVAVPCHEESAPTVFEMFSLEVRPESLLGWIELGQAGIQRGDQSSCVNGVERFGGDR